MKKDILISSSNRRSDENGFILKLVAVTCVLSAVLLCVGISLLSTLPREAFAVVLTSNRKEKKEICTSYIYPEPSEELRAKADRLKEIRYEEYLEHIYTSLDAELDNVYVYDSKKICYLTFDDGPSAVTENILDVLREYKVKATFFVTGNRVEANSKIIKAIINDGHSIGNHTHSHEYASVYESSHSFKNEVLKCKKAIDTALGYEYDNLIFRFPGGYNSLTDENSKSEYRKILSDMGYKYIDWSALTGDSNTTEPNREYIMDTLAFSIDSSKTGDAVVLMHDSTTKEITAQTLPSVIEYLYDKGFSFKALTNK